MKIENSYKYKMFFLLPLLQVHLLRRPEIAGKLVNGYTEGKVNRIDIYTGWLFWTIKFRIDL